MRVAQEAVENPKENPREGERKQQRASHLADENLTDVEGGQREDGKQREQNGIERIFFEHVSRYFTR